MTGYENNLTLRERQLLRLIALGHSAKEAARECCIAARTVETHLDTMRLKLRARNRTHMVAIALARGWLEGIDPRDVEGSSIAAEPFSHDLC